MLPTVDDMIEQEIREMESEAGMAFKIKPEDISDEFVQARIDAPFIPGIRENMAAIIEAAIEAGLVSPPCHVLKRDDGYVIDHGDQGGVRVWPGKAWGPNVEHYWGQEA